MAEPKAGWDDLNGQFTGKFFTIAETVERAAARISGRPAMTNCALGEAIRRFTGKTRKSRKTRKTQVRGKTSP